MQPLDKHSLFAIFEANDEEVYKEHEVTEVLQNPYVLMGMVLRGLENFTLLDIMYTRSYPKQYASVRNVVKAKYYTTLYSYLERIDSTKFESIYTIGESFEHNRVLLGLQTLLEFFEKAEDYVKCGVIKNYHDLIASTIIKRELDVQLL